MEKIVVTGGLGFIGSNFVDFLSKKYDLSVLDNETYAGRKENIDIQIDVMKGDVSNIWDVLKMKDANVIFHFAAESHVGLSIEQPKRFIDTNIYGTFNILELARKFDIKKLIYISSVEVYGSGINFPMKENHPLNPNSPYAASKASADRLCYSYYKTYGIPVTIIRPGNQYGKKQHIEKLVPKFITQVLNNQPMSIHGNGLQTRDWTYVEDLCDGLEKVMKSKNANGEVFNMARGEELSILQIAEMIKKMMPSYNPKIEFVPDRKGQVERFLFSSEKAKKILGWEAKTPFLKGLEYTIKWYENNIKWIKNTKFLK